MALADHKPTPAIHGKPCSVGALLDTLAATDQSELLSWLDDPSVEHESIWRSLRKAGHRVGKQTVGRHRRGECKCAA